MAVSVAADRTLKASLCEESALTVAAATPVSSATTEPLVPATTVRVLGTTSKATETVASAVAEPAASAHGLPAGPPAHADKPPDSVQPAKR